MKTRKSLPFLKLSSKWSLAVESTKTALKELYRLELKGKLTDGERATMNGIRICNYGYTTSDLPEEIRKEIELKFGKSEIPRIK